MVWPIVWDEIRTFCARLAGLRPILLHLALLAAFGVWIPRAKGIDFFEPEVLGAYACLGLIFAGPAVAQSSAEGFAPPFALAIARIVTGVLYGEAVVAALIGTGIATIHILLRGHYIPSPDWPSLASCAIFGLCGAAMAASMAAWLASQFSRQAATVTLRVLFFSLLILFYYRGHWLTDVAFKGAAICFALTAIFLLLLRRACR
jgi:hypothetical protein